LLIESRRWRTGPAFGAPWGARQDYLNAPAGSFISGFASSRAERSSGLWSIHCVTQIRQPVVVMTTGLAWSHVGLFLYIAETMAPRSAATSLVDVLKEKRPLASHEMCPATNMNGNKPVTINMKLRALTNAQPPAVLPPAQRLTIITKTPRPISHSCQTVPDRRRSHVL